jgi:hypothetical protein
VRLLGTIKEWIEHDPSVFLVNKKFLQEGAAIHNFYKLDKPEKFYYPTKGNSISLQYTDTKNYHSTPLIFFGGSAAYMATGEFEYVCNAIYWPSGSGTSYPISEEMLNDPNWEECPIWKGMEK